MARQITEITRRDLREAISDVAWWGRLEEVEFLSRLYSLDELPSYDGRYKDAEGDIFQHRVNNSDWDNDWVFSDSRFGLANGEDDDFLRFLTEMLHPTVRRQEEAQAIIERVNPLLRSDGYQIVKGGAISGRPTYAWQRVEIDNLSLDQHFTKDLTPLMATVSELAKEGGSGLEQQVLKGANAKLEEPEYDNWNGGTYYYTLNLRVPVALFACLGDETSSLEQQIAKRIDQIQRGSDSHRITAVVIQPGLVRPNEGAKKLSRLIEQRAQGRLPQFWTPGQFRLFLSHVTLFRQRTAALRRSLARFHISAFVAHDTIEPGELWQREIEAALRSMDAMAAILTPEFPASRWTDQEVGWALGAGLSVLPIRRGLDPYGFIAEVQGIQGLNKTVNVVAEEVFLTLLKQKPTRTRLLEAIVDGFERSSSSTDAVTNVSLIERAGPFPSILVQRLESAATVNSSLAATKGLRERVQRVARAIGGRDEPFAAGTCSKHRKYLPLTDDRTERRREFLGWIRSGTFCKAAGIFQPRNRKAKCVDRTCRDRCREG